jgi:hypothetical protein
MADWGTTTSRASFCGALSGRGLTYFFFVASVRVGQAIGYVPVAAHFVVRLAAQ